MVSTAAQKQDARERQQNKRDRDAGRPESYPRIDRAEVKRRESQNAMDLAWAKEQDNTGKFYRSECRSCVDLLAIYEGANILDKESDEDEETSDSKKKPKKKENRPNPSTTKITIRAIKLGDINLEPDCDFALRRLNEVDEIVSFRRWLDLRDKARKDLLWLGRLLGWGWYHSVHQYICDQFVQKNFDGMYFPGYTLDDFHDMVRAQKRTVSATDLTPTREMVLLESRGGYKSTIDGVDAAQWLINCPDVRILIITGVKSLAKKLARQIKKYFYLSQNAEPTVFQLLFPEYILAGVDGRSETPLDCPAARFNQKESNLWVSSIESANTGDHCDVLKGDDVVTSKNSEEEELREKLKFEFDSIDEDNRDPWGITDIAGTRYFTDDWYGTRALPDVETGEIAPYRYSCRGCWTLPSELIPAYQRKEITLKNIIDGRLATLTFPARNGWAELRKKLNKKGERSFKNQQLNEPTDARDISGYINHFDIEVLRAHSHPREWAPKVGDIYITWDWALSDHKTSDYSVGVAAMVYQKPDRQYALCILEIIFDKWKDSELVHHIIAFYKKWNPKRVVIEASNAVSLLKTALQNNSYRLGVPEIMNDGVIYWKPVDNSANAKFNRVKSIELLLAEDRFDFINGLWIDETFKQLTNFTGEKSTAYRKDDIPDALSFLVDLLPYSAVPGREVDPRVAEREVEIAQAKERLQALHKRMFGGGGAPPAAPAPAPIVPERDPRKSMMDKILPPGMRT
jgi:hypothetical protein